VGVLVKQKEQAIGSEGNGNQWERGKEGKKKDKKMKRTSKRISLTLVFVLTVTGIR
jgi:hypothetical protein